MDKAAFQAALVAAGLSRLVKDIDRLARPSIRLSATEADESLMNVGASKLGGVPDLPPGVSWPELKGEPQSFIAQIRLDDVSQYDTEKVLPQSGMLWFFYDAQQQTFGEDPADRGGWQVSIPGWRSHQITENASPGKASSNEPVSCLFAQLCKRVNVISAAQA